MKITNIEVKNFRAFPKTYRINLHNAGKNLLVYGENGSGKSSLYLALKLFLESGVPEDNGDNKNREFEIHQNIFTKDPGHIKLHFRSQFQREKDTYEWSRDIKETTDELIIETAKAKGFLDYKSLLETHYVHREDETVNLFDLLVKTLLANTTNSVTERTLAEDWNAIQPPFPRRGAKHQIADLERRIVNFNRELTNRLAELHPKVSEILNKFGYKVELDFDFQGVTYNQGEKILDNQEILLKVEFFDTDIPSHHLLLNEAKLSAIAIAIYLSSILCLPEPKGGMKILALDDVLIGLDMSNRLPILDILEEYFPDYQIFLTTYDKAWYEIVKQRTAHGGKWKSIEFYFDQSDKYEMPICKEDAPYLNKAREYLGASDYKACAVYLRTAFEAIIKRFCDKRNLRVRYCENPKSLTSQDFWDPIKTGIKRNGTPFLQETLVRQIELYRSIILNPLNHAIITNIPKREVEEAIQAVEKLETALANV